MRRFLQILVPLLLPWLTYYLYALWQDWCHAKRGQPRTRPAIPHVRLLIAGVLLLIVSLGVTAFIGGAPPGSQYHPATIENGVNVPGGFEPQKVQP